MKIDKRIAIAMLKNHWVRDAVDITSDGSRVQLVLVERADTAEPFEGLTDEMLSFIQSGAVQSILGCAADTNRKIINMVVRPGSTRTEDRP